MEATDLVVNTDDILSILFSLLDTTEQLVNCERVCRRWRRVSAQSLLWKQWNTSVWDHWHRSRDDSSSQFVRKQYLHSSAVII
jgi:hypothetical protein